MTTPQFLTDLLTLLFDLAVPAAMCTMVLAGLALLAVLTDDVVSRCFGIAVRIHRTDGRWSAVHPAEVASR